VIFEPSQKCSARRPAGSLVRIGAAVLRNIMSARRTSLVLWYQMTAFMAVYLRTGCVGARGWAPFGMGVGDRSEESGLSRNDPSEVMNPYPPYRSVGPSGTLRNACAR